ncbi:unnamed protein product [Rodentolepis nana]|uniref:SERPIN domain-containing protein n=1 Tax=Rodentolepis nana TaxID=102285 RepID=A0A0R3T456_RODNA|nr:unnamed protein product [Rodentolepis nana]
MCGPKIITHDDFNAGFLEASIKTYGNGGNYVASPMSVLVLMSALLTAKGPQNDTATEICEALVGRTKKHTCTDEADYKEVVSLLEKIRTVVETAKSPEGKSALKISNAAFIEESLLVKDLFIKKFTYFHGDTVKRTRFNNLDAFENINKWANTVTDGLIPRYLNSKDELPEDTLLVLLNAITFKDEWAEPFYSNFTSHRNFHLSKDETIRVPMMDMESDMYYFEDEVCKVVNKPFRDSRFSFVIYLPKEDFELKDIEAKMVKEDFVWLKESAHKFYEPVRLILPKFKVEHRLDLKPILQLLGIRSIFTRGVANLKGISSDVDLYASGAKQVAMMEVDEGGARAAAVTGIELSSRFGFSPTPELFIVNRPFYCAIFDNQLQMPLFIARIVDPR